MKTSELIKLFDPIQVKWKVQTSYSNDTKCICVAYIDARDVMDVLNKQAGPGGWQDRIEASTGKVVCHIWIKVDDEWIRKSDMGDTKDWEEKSASSWAFKRAGIKRGIGKFLYNMDKIYLDYKKEWKFWNALMPNGDKIKDLTKYCNDLLSKKWK